MARWRRLLAKSEAVIYVVTKLSVPGENNLGLGHKSGLGPALASNGPGPSAFWRAQVINGRRFDENSMGVSNCFGFLAREE